MGRVQRFILSVVIICWTSSSWGGAVQKEALNLVKDIHFVQREDGANLFLQMEQPPIYNLALVSSHTLKLLIPKCKVLPRVVQRVISGPPALTLNTTELGEMSLSLTFVQGIEEIRQGWIKDHKILHLRFLYKKDIVPQPPPRSKHLTLKRIRFGLRKGFTRVVLDLDGKPMWYLVVSPGRLIQVNMEKTNYEGPLNLKKIKRVKRIWLKKQGENLQLFIEPALSHLNSSVIWLDKGNRLVVDVYQKPASLDKKVARLPSDFGGSPSRGGAKEEVKSGLQAQEELIGGRTKPQEVSKKALESKGPKGGASLHTNALNTEEPSLQRSRDLQAKKKNLNKDQALHYGLIMAARDLREFSKGIALIEEFHSKWPDSPVAEELYFLKADFYMGLFEHQQGSISYQSVVQSYQRAVDKYPGSALVREAYLKMARAARMGGDYYAAMSFINLLFEKYPSKDLLPAILLERAYNYRRINLPDKAFEDFKRIVKHYPQSPQADEASMGVASYLHQRGLYKEAEEWLAKLSERNPLYPLAHPEYHLLRGKNYIYLKKFQESRDLFFQALNMGGTEEPPDLIITRIADTYWYEGRTPEAKSLYTYVAAHHPGSEGASIAQLRLAEITYGVEAFKELYEKYQDRPIGELALLKLANLYFKNKDYAGVLECLKELILRPADDQTERAARVLFQRAAKAAIQKAVGQGEEQDAVDIFESNKVFLEEELDPGTLMLLAEAYVKLGQYGQGLEILEKIKPSDLSATEMAQYYLARARCLKGMGQVSQAINILKKHSTLSASPHMKAQMEIFLADLYWEASREEEAMALYSALVPKEALLGPEDRKRLHFRLGKLLNSRHRPTEARKHLEKAMALSKQEGDGSSSYGLLMMELARSYKLEGKMEQAVEVLEEGIAKGLKPEHELYWDVNYKLAQYYQRLGQEAKAVALYKRISEEGPSHLQLLVQLRLGSIDLNRKLRQLQYWSEVDGQKKLNK